MNMHLRALIASTVVKAVICEWVIVVIFSSPPPVASLPPRCGATLPDVVVLLDVDLVKHHVFLLGVYVGFHLQGNVAGKH